MAIEIERKFLVTGEYKSLSTSHSHIIQGYISSQKGRTVRVRIRDRKAYLTIKGPSRDGGLSRYEFEKEITLDEGLSLLSSPSTFWCHLKMPHFVSYLTPPTPPEHPLRNRNAYL